MGAYVYKVTAKTKILKDGTKANIAEFAYKPFYGWDEETDARNRRMRKQTACHIADRFVRTSKNFTGRVVLEADGEDALEVNRGTFTDDWFDNQLWKLKNARAA